MTRKSLVTLRGTASDDTGIQGVTVNGVQATITPVPVSNSKVIGKTSRRNDEVLVEWEVELDLPFGDTDVEVVAEDADGNEAEEPEEVLIRHTRFAPSAVLDAVNNRLVGLEEFNAGLAFDLATNTISEIPGISTGQLHSVSADGTGVFFVTQFDNVLTLRSQNLQTGFESVEGSVNFSYDETAWEFVNFWDLVLHEQSNEAYLLYLYVPVGGGTWETRIFHWDLSEGDLTELPLFVDGGNLPIIDEIESAGDKLIGLVSPFVGNASDNSVVEINVETGEVSPVAENINAVANRFVIDNTFENAYLVGYDEVSRVVLETGAVEPVSIDAEEDLLNFSQINKTILLDTPRNRLIVGDIAINELITVDLDTGERALLYPNGIGEGRKMITPRELALNAANTIAYTLDDGGNAPESLFRIDLDTGLRTRLGDVATEYNTIANGLALDEENNRLFYALGENVYEMDLETEEIEVLVSDVVGTGISLNSVTGIHFDPAISQVLLVDAAQNILVGLDPSTKNRELIFDLTEGESPVIEVPLDVAASADGSFYYVLGQKLGALFEVNSETGERRLLLDECLNDFDQNTLPEDSAIQNMDFNAQTNKFLITGDYSVIEYDLAEDACRVISNGSDAFDLLYQNDGTILGSSWNVLGQFDPENGEFLILSK